MEENTTKFYLIDDLKNILDIRPCSTKTDYISYSKARLLEKIKQDFDGERLFLKRNIWNDEDPEIYGLNNATPYSKEVEEFSKSKKKHGGGRNLIVMNEAYFLNAYYIIESMYWELKQNPFKRGTRTCVKNKISDPVMNGDETELRHEVEQLLNGLYDKVNKKISSLNDFLKSKYSQFVFYQNFYKGSLYVQQLIGYPTELLRKMGNQMDIMEKGFELLSPNDKKQKKFIDNIVSVLSEKNYPKEDMINTIADRIYFTEMPLIQQLRKIYDEFEKIKAEIYQLEEEIKAETERRLKASERIHPNSLIIQHAKDNGLIGISFQLSDK